jgi:hypothetical protein
MPSRKPQNGLVPSEFEELLLNARHYGLLGTMLSGVSAMVRPEGVGKHSAVTRTIADTLPLN